MLALKKDYEEGGVQFLFSRKSTAKTQLCAKILTSAFMEDITVYTEHLKKSEWSFDDIYYDKTKR